MTPKGVLDMRNKDTGDVRGDTSFVLSRRTVAYQCRQDPSSFFCSGLTQFAGDDSNSTDIIIEFQLEVDGQWGPYLFCNPVDSKNPLGPWDCDVDLGGSSTVPPPQCKKFNYSLYGKAAWTGFGAKNTSAPDIGACCGIANARSAHSKWNWYNESKQCETFSLALGNKDCHQCTLGYFDNTPPPCNCSRVHKTVGRENLTVTFAGFNSMHPAGGIWFSHPAQGECKGGHYVGDGSGCTWRVIQNVKTIHAPCMYERMDGNVENYDKGCFAACPQPKNVTGDCYLKCYSASSAQMTHEQLIAPWTKAFASDDAKSGGCPPSPSTTTTTSDMLETGKKKVVATPMPTTLENDLNSIVQAEADKYDCAISASIYSASRSIAMSAAAGTTSLKPLARNVTADDIFIWGSITKPSTGTAILRAVQQGKITLNDTISQYIDPMIAQMAKDYPNDVNFTTSEDLWGEDIHQVTIWHLATMNSGVPDFDTAKPYPPPPKDALRKTIYSNPTHDYAPHELISFAWVATGSLEFTPGTKRFRYSSTNFVLLGLILAHLDGQIRWTDYEQSTFLPANIRKELESVVYYRMGAPSNRTEIVGYDRTSYNGHSPTSLPGTDVSDVHGVFGGWTASDFTSDTLDAAKFAYHVYSTETQELLTSEHQKLMIPTNGIYGFATFDLSFENGYSKTKYGKSYGHIGATYGYDSMLSYHPALDVTIAIGTNMENDDQTHPSDTLCVLYGAIYNHLTNSTDSCTYTMRGYYGGECKCTSR